MMDDAEREAFRLALRRAVADRERAEATISFLTEKLGISLPGSSTELLDPGDGPESSELRDVGPVHVADSEFYGHSQTQAARAFLERAGRARPQKTAVIVQALRKGGVTVGGKDPEGTIYKILRRDKSFHRVGTSLWGLAAWYPNAALRPAKVADVASSEAPADVDGQPQDEGTPVEAEEVATEG